MSMEKQIERIEQSLAKLVGNDLPHLKSKLAVLDERTKGHGRLLVLLLTMALTLGPAILVTVLVK